MRMSLLSVLLILFTLKIFAQSNNVQSAANSLKYSELEKDKKYTYLQEAKDFIDRAAANEQTANNYKMWYYRGKIYLTIFSDTAVKKIDKDAAENAAISFVNCLKTDTKEWFKEECDNLVGISGIASYNDAIEAYHNQDYDKAIRLYKLILDIIPLDKQNNLKTSNITQGVLYRNLYFASSQAKDRANAKIYLQKLIDMSYNDPLIYAYMERIYLEEKDTTKALSYIELGRSIFEDNMDLINEELNIYIAQGNTDVLIKKLTDAINLDPEREILYFNRGVLYEKKKELNKAIEDYKKALELNPDYFEVNYNLGALYFNEGAEMYNKANDIKSDTEYEKAKQAADERLKQALPYLEKAKRLNTKDKNTLISLKQIYARLNENEKLSKIDALLKELQ